MFGLNTAMNDYLSTQLTAPNTINGIYNPFRVADTCSAQITCSKPITNPTVEDRIKLIGISNYLKINNL